MEDMNSRLANCKNRLQGEAKRVLCVCSAGLLRSPTAAFVLSQDPYGYNTRSCGLTPEYALIPFDPVLLRWADEVVCMEEWMEKEIAPLIARYPEKKLVCLGIEDSYGYKDPNLINQIREKYDAIQKA